MIKKPNLSDVQKDSVLSECVKSTKTVLGVPNFVSLDVQTTPIQKEKNELLCQDMTLRF